ncbi:MAG: hypothetical protein GY794_06650 [bacterium]|nr:hypothetical protein [bacterium]
MRFSILAVLALFCSVIACVQASKNPIKADAIEMAVRRADNDQHLEIFDGDKCVLRYNFRNVPVPKTAKGKYAVPRSDYIHPLYGPGGEVLTKDYSPRHPHHRGLYWAWPEVYYKSQRRDLHALQGVFARPDKIVRAEGGKDSATITAKSKWLWDKEEIVSETATITANRAGADGLRIIDLRFEFTALVEGVSIARRGRKAYGGFNMRLSTRKDQKIIKHTDPVGKKPRRAWAQLVGTPPKGKTPVTVAVCQHVTNPCAPGDWVTYPEINWLQPTFPSKGVKYELAKGKPLVLRFRLCIQNGKMTDEQLAKQWKDFNRPTIRSSR